MSKKLLHTIVVLNYLYGIWYDLTYIKIPKIREDIAPLNGRLKYLTFWNMLLQGFFFAVCLLNDFVGTNEIVPNRTPFIRKFKDMILTCLAFPLSMFVGITFWGLYFVDRELIFPKVLDLYFPVWLNHVMHTNIMLFVTIEMYISFRKYPPRKQGVSILMLFMAVYLIWIHVINFYTGMWVYPVLEVLNFPLRIVFFVVLLGFIVFLYILGEKVNSLIWRKQLRAVTYGKSNVGSIPHHKRT